MSASKNLQEGKARFLKAVEELTGPKHWQVWAMWWVRAFDQDPLAALVALEQAQGLQGTPEIAGEWMRTRFNELCG